MIDTKLYEELMSKRTELRAEVKVCNAMWDFMHANAIRCMNERNFAEADVWTNAMKSVTARLEVISKEYDILIEQIKSM